MSTAERAEPRETAELADRSDMLSVSRSIAAPVAEVRALFWDIASWHAVWDRITSVRVHYDDGAHQEFDLEVERDGRTEFVRTVRFLAPGGDIEFFSPTPPPGMADHVGAWRFTEQDGGCLVTAERNYELLPAQPGGSPSDPAHQDYRDAYRRRFEDRLGRILDSFVSHFEAGAQPAPAALGAAA
ncbi:SRPBCC family protein [Kitasatospora sp. NPDC101155]|uniref:SRPBCC family protein n=1 Tax=Kitasatospora sp. NPDC101155 TaxID=3364097 RepID=UPI00380E5FE8